MPSVSAALPWLTAISRYPEIAVNQGSAADTLGTNVRIPVTLS